MPRETKVRLLDVDICFRSLHFVGSFVYPILTSVRSTQVFPNTTCDLFYPIIKNVCRLYSTETRSSHLIDSGFLFDDHRRDNLFLPKDCQALERHLTSLTQDGEDYQDLLKTRQESMRAIVDVCYSRVSGDMLELNSLARKQM
jgi:hypothetical protein